MTQLDADIAAVRAATQTYLDALYEGSADKLATVFLPTSALTQSFEGELKVTPRDEWLAAVRTRPSPKASGLARRDEILTVDVISETLAHVKVNCAIPPRFFTDILSFVKLNGEWKVAQKVFTTSMR